MKVIGLDLSLTSPGFADESGAWSLKVPTKLRGPERLEHIRKAVQQLVLPNGNLRGISTSKNQLVVIEHYSLGSAYNREALAELGGVIRLTLWRAGVPYVEVAPTRLKKFATGKGNADKDSVLIQAVRKSKLDLDGNDAADAWWLRQMALVHYGLPGAVKVAEVNRQAVSAIDWPVMEAVA